MLSKDNTINYHSKNNIIKHRNDLFTPLINKNNEIRHTLIFKACGQRDNKKCDGDLEEACNGWRPLGK